MADDLRQRIAEALVSTIGQATIILGSSVADMVGRQPGDVTEYDLADAVMAVRDEELERHRRENEQWAATYGRHAQLRIQEALLIAALDSQETDRG